MPNRILFKKIKFPLLLRGTFPHVIARERSDRSNLNTSGFSLIELMVAVVILVMAIFGIFQAYSVGFMGMADARDRTVATNYVQEMIENYKNMDFKQVKSEPITLIPDTKFSRGAYVLNLKEIDEVITLKEVITQVRWIDRKGNIKTEKASTIIYNRPTTSEVGDTATKLVLYAQSYYTILPTNDVNLVAEIKDENGNIYDYDGEIKFSVVTVRIDGIPLQVGDIATEPPIYANDGVAYCTFTAISGTDIEGTERIQASATVDGNYLTDTVNIRVTAGPVGIILEPATEEDRVRAAGAGVASNINLHVVKADYDYINNPVAYGSPITLSADGPGTLSKTTFASVPTEGTSFTVTPNGPGIVKITASAPDLDMGYTEITFTGEPASILIAPEKKSIYPGEDIGVTVTIVDKNNVPVEYDGVVNLSVDPDYGSFSPNSLDFGETILLELKSTFTAYTDAPPGKTITLIADSNDGLSGSFEITILSSLIPKYLKLSPISQSVDLNGTDDPPTITATVTDNSGTIVTTYSTPIIFEAKEKDGEYFGGFPLSNPETQSPIEGEVNNIVFDTSGDSGTATITASSGDLILEPEEGIEVVFYQSANHIELSAVPTSIEAGGHETSFITATVCDAGGNRVANYDANVGTITLTTSKGIFPYTTNELKNTITLDEFYEGEVTADLSSNESGTAVVTAESSDGLNSIGYDVTVEFTGNIPTEISDPFNIAKWTDYLISFDINVSGSPLYLEKITVEWNNPSAVLSEIIVNSPNLGDEIPLIITSIGSDSPCIENEFTTKTLVITGTSNISLLFSDSAIAKKKVTVIFTDEDNIDYPVSFTVPN